MANWTNYIRFSPLQLNVNIYIHLHTNGIALGTFYNQVEI